jgi:hypothetical protein
MPLPLSADILPSVPSSEGRRATHSTGTFEAPLSALTTSRAANPARGDVASEIPVLAAQLCRWDSRLVLLQYADDLVFREPASLHLRLLLDGVQFKPMAFQGNVSGYGPEAACAERAIPVFGRRRSSVGYLC